MEISKNSTRLTCLSSCCITPFVPHNSASKEKICSNFYFNSLFRCLVGIFLLQEVNKNNLIFIDQGDFDFL